jgi:hypothetical protein
VKDSGVDVLGPLTLWNQTAMTASAEHGNKTIGIMLLPETGAR